MGYSMAQGSAPGHMSNRVKGKDSAVRHTWQICVHPAGMGTPGRYADAMFTATSFEADEVETAQMSTNR